MHIKPTVEQIAMHAPREYLDELTRRHANAGEVDWDAFEVELRLWYEHQLDRPVPAWAAFLVGLAIGTLIPILIAISVGRHSAGL